MLDADAPGELRHRATANAHVTTCADCVVVQTGIVENRRRAIDRPALHEPGGIDGTIRRAHVEVPISLIAELLATVQDLPHLRMGVLALQLAAIDAADLAVVFEGAEGRVDPAQPVEQFVEHFARAAIAEVHDERQAHDLLDPADAGECCGGSDGHAFSAFTIADWSDCSNPALVSVAPETMLRFALCAFSASAFKMGRAFWLMNTERSV